LSECNAVGEEPGGELVTMETQLDVIPVPYGRETIDIAIPSERLAWVCSPKDVPGVKDIGQAVNDALDNLIGCPDLPTIVGSRGKNTVILVDDYTRTTPQAQILPVVLNRLNELGIPDSSITLIIAGGTHRQMTREECLAKFGAEIMDRVRVIPHMYDDPNQLVELGTTKLGVPISVNRRYYEANLSIAVGNIVPHIYAGWSGGAKLVQPGVSGPATTAATHMVAAPRFREILGRVDNPVRREMEEVARQSGLDLIINTVLNRRGEVVKVVAGDVVAAHREGVRHAEEVYSVQFSELPDVVLASSYPGNADFWQASKAYSAASLMVKPGGTIILMCPAWGGLAPGHPILYSIGELSYEEALEGADCGRFEDEVAVAWYLTLCLSKEQVARTYVYSDGLKESEIEQFGFQLIDDPQETLDRVLTEMGSGARVGVITHGGDINPVRV